MQPIHLHYLNAPAVATPEPKSALVGRAKARSSRAVPAVMRRGGHVAALLCPPYDRLEINV